MQVDVRDLADLLMFKLLSGRSVCGQSRLTRFRA
jgi:hypothetical protein